MNNGWAFFNKLLKIMHRHYNYILKERIMKIKTIRLSICVIAIAVFGLVSIQGCSQNSNPKFQTEYQAVVLTNGPVFFGKVEFLGTEYVLLKDVYYIRSQVNQETKQVTNTLIKKGQELHGAELTYINARQIVMIEPVAAESQVAKLIRDAKAQKPPEAPKQ
jgi:hypothetical protein